MALSSSSRRSSAYWVPSRSSRLSSFARSACKLTKAAPRCSCNAAGGAVDLSRHGVATGQTVVHRGPRQGKAFGPGVGGQPRPQSLRGCAVFLGQLARRLRLQSRAGGQLVVGYGRVVMGPAQRLTHSACQAGLRPGDGCARGPTASSSLRAAPYCLFQGQAQVAGRVGLLAPAIEVLRLHQSLGFGGIWRALAEVDHGLGGQRGHVWHEGWLDGRRCSTWGWSAPEGRHAGDGAARRGDTAGSGWATLRWAREACTSCREPLACVVPGA